MSIENSLKPFMELFKARADRWGGIIEKDGKKSGVSNPGPVTEQHYRDHLEGKVSMGAYPLLDDGTVNFFAIDLDWHDEKKSGPPDFNIALKVRDGFIKQGIQVYIANSKSMLGFHVYGFFSGPVQAANIRKIAIQVLHNLDVKNAEIFPKQDKVDSTVKYGNYINLPYFGDSHRKFLKTDRSEVELEEALAKIRKIDPAVVFDLAEKIVVQNTITDVEKALKESKTRGRPKNLKHPPCITELLKGVGKGLRDVAAFTLASHFITDQGMSPDDALEQLQKWNARNDPPLDPRDLIEKVKSAAKGYDVGCKKIQGEPILHSYCVGEGNCQWLQVRNKEKIKSGAIKIVSFYESETHLYEEIIMEGRPVFASYEKKTGLLVPVDKIEISPEEVLLPFPIERDGELYESRTVLPVVTLPTGVEEYGKEEDLIQEIKDIIGQYIDMSPDDLLFSTYYILVSWVFDQIDTICYLRFMGDTGTGKSTALDVIGKLCYKPMMAAGAVTPAPIYRLIRKWGGSLILDEGDMKFSDVESDIVKIFNCGFNRGRSVVRCLMDDPVKMITSQVYGPKVFSTRQSFDDKALESRCLTIQMEATDRLLPIADGKTFLRRMEHLRNKLLVWRFRKYSTVNGEEAINVPLPAMLEPRMRQIARPFALIFKDNKEVMEQFHLWIIKKQIAITEEKADSPAGRMLHAIFKLAKTNGRDYITNAAVIALLSSEFKLDIKSPSLTKLMKSLKIVKEIKHHGTSTERCVVWNIKLMKKLLNNYFLVEEREEYGYLTLPPTASEVTEEEKEEESIDV
jgi:hypothetical protein